VRALIVALGIVALLAAGCGGKSSSSGTTSGTAPATTAPAAPPLSKAGYQAMLKRISTEIGKSITKSSSSGKIAKGDVDQLVRAFHTFADRLRELNPPAAIKQVHARLIKALEDLGDEFPNIARKLNSAGKDPSTAITALFGAHAVQELIKVGEELRKAGYDLDLNP
jgi:hypothetical protein